MSNVCKLIGVCVGCMLLAGCTSRGSDEGPSVSASMIDDHGLKVQEASISPDPITKTGHVSVSLSAKDFGREQITYQYRWYVNGALMPNDMKIQLATENLRRGDLVMAEVILSDGKMTGVPYKT